MAIYHLSGSVISRSQGRSAIACAAYRSAERLLDERLDKVHDYTHKQDVAFTEILLPENAPLWMKTRERLWNAVEASEKRKDAQLAREMQIALPRELTVEQNIELAREFIQSEFVDRGMVADWAFHLDNAKDGEAQPHIHVMLTMRAITEEGFGQKVRIWNAKENLLLWRERWAETANRHLALNGIDRQIDHRSHLERGIELEPQHKIGAVVAQDRLARLADHQRIARENGAKILANPYIALDAITCQQSTFTHHDLAKFIARHSVDSEQFQHVYEKVKADKAIVALGIDEQGRERFTTKAMLALEQEMLTHGNFLIDRLTHKLSQNAHQRGMINRSLSDEQQAAYEHLLELGNLKCVVGYAGTGKSYLLGAAKAVWEAEGYQVHGVTLSGVAAENLEASSGIESRTLASREYYWDKGQELLSAKDIVVVDEAGLLGSRQMVRILREAEQHGSKVVLVGDPEQLQAIEAGAAFRALSERVGYVELTEVRRQKVVWQREATQDFANGRTLAALNQYQQHEHVHEFATQAMAKKALVEQWNDVRINEKDKIQVMLAYTRKDVKELNEMARQLRKDLGELGQAQSLVTSRGEKTFAENERIYFLQNDRALGVRNGSLGTIERIEGKNLYIRLDQEDNRKQKSLAKVIEFNIERYNHLDYGYATTMYKSQCLTVDRTYVLASKHMDRHATYVSMSRHRESADLFWSQEEFSNERTLGQALNRERAKDVTLDYTNQESLRQQYANDRGIHPIEVSERLQQRLPQAPYEQLKSSQLDSKQASKSFSTAISTTSRETREQSLDAFKARYEQKNQVLAKQHQETVLPSQEKDCAKVVAYYKELQLQLSRGEKSQEKIACEKALGDLAERMTQSSAMLNYLQHYEKELCQEVQAIAKARVKERERQLKRGKGRGFGLEL